jgi:hypothetical protein
MAAEDRPNYDPGISYAQRQILYRATGDRYWLENEHITKEQAGKQFALIRGKKKMENKPIVCQCFYQDDEKKLMEWAVKYIIDDMEREFGQLKERTPSVDVLVNKWKTLQTKVKDTPVCEAERLAHHQYGLDYKESVRRTYGK